MKSMKLLIAALAALMLLSACGAKEKPSEKNVSLQEVVEAVKKAYGEDYIPSMEVDANAFATLATVDANLIDSMIGEMPMMSTHVDTFFAIKAKEGKGADVEKALKAYREFMITTQITYPMNEAKVQASEVVREGDYVFFVMLGAFDERSEVTEAQALEFAKEQNDIGVQAIKSFFK